MAITDNQTGKYKTLSELMGLVQNADEHREGKLRCVEAFLMENM